MRMMIIFLESLGFLPGYRCPDITPNLQDVVDVPQVGDDVWLQYPPKLPLGIANRTNIGHVGYCQWTECVRSDWDQLAIWACHVASPRTLPACRGSSLILVNHGLKPQRAELPFDKYENFKPDRREFPRGLTGLILGDSQPLSISLFLTMPFGIARGGSSL